MQVSRVLSHGKVESLESGFKLPKGTPFSIYVKPKGEVDAIDVLINVKCICDEQPSELPVPVNDWTPAEIVEIAPNSISLTDYDVYWGAGQRKDK